MSDKPKDGAAPEQRPETLLNIPAVSEIKESSGETLLDLSASPAGESVLSRVRRTTGAEIKGSTLAATEPATEPGSNAPTASGSSVSSSGTFTERVRSASDDAIRYEAKRELGRGGMGVVVAVRDNDLRRDVAMKVMRADRVKINTNSGQAALQRFVEEAQITGQLEHPNIVPIHELGADASGRVYFTMKLVHGQPLSEILKQLRRGDQTTERDFPLDRLLQVFMKVCDAMSFAHAHNVVHRDLKPENIMVGRFGEALVMDWGLARIITDGGMLADETETAGIETDTRGTTVDPESRAPSAFSMEGSIAGTPAYMAPEQARGEISRIDQRTDVFALGAILYEILVLKPPYSGAGGTQIIEKAARGEVTDPFKRVAQDEELRERLRRLPGGRIPPELAAIAMHALNTAMNDRYPTARALKDDVENYIAGRPVTVHRDALTVRMAKWVRRHPTLSMSASAAAAVLLISVATIMLIVAEARKDAIAQQQQIVIATQEAEAEAQRRAEAEGEAASRQRELTEAALRREAELARRAQATELYRLGLVYAERTREITDDELRTAARDTAITTLEKAGEQDESYVDPRFALARLYHFLLDERAIEYYLLASTLAGGDARSLVYAGDFARIGLADNERALGYYRQAASVSESDPLALVGMGWSAFLDGDFSQALTYAAAAREIDPTLWEPWLLEGTIRARVFKEGNKELNPEHDAERAHDALTEAIRRNNREGIIFNERATTLITLNRYEEAISDLRRCEDLQPGLTSTLLNYAICLRYLLELDAADEVLDRIAETDPNNPTLWLERGLVQQFQNNPEAAIAMFEKSLELAPGRLSPMYNLARCLIVLSRFDEAEAYLNKISETAPGLADLNYDRGSVLFRLGRVDEAIAMYRAAQEADPNDITVLTNIAIILANQDKLEEAERVVEQIRALNDNHPDYWNAAAAVATKRGDYASAVTHLRRAIELGTTRDDATLNLAVNLRLMGRAKEALEITSQIINKPLAPSAAYAEHGHALLLLGRLDEALKSLATAREWTPEMVSVWINSAAVCNKIGRYEDALTFAQRATEIDPDYILGWVQMSQSHINLGNEEAAEAALRRALELETDHAMYVRDIATLLHNLGHQEDAIATARRAIEIDPTLAPAWSALASMLQSASRFEESIAAHLETFRLNPTDPEPLMYVAHIYNDLGEHERCIAYARRVLEVAPTHVRANLFIGHARMALNRFELAAESYGLVTILDPSHPLAWLNLGVARIRLGAVPSAIEALTRATEADPKLGPAWEYLGLCESSRGNKEVALAHYEKSFEVDPQRGGAAIGAAQMANDLELPQKALQYGREAVRLAPGNVASWYQYGRACYALEMYEDGATAFGRVAQMAPNVAIVHYMLAACLVETGEYERARNDGERAFQLDPTLNYALVIAARASVNLDEHDKAIDQLERALQAGATNAQVFNNAAFEPLHEREDWQALKAKHVGEE